MRIGTWNLAGRWTIGHQRLLAGAACDIWLLTEIAPATSLEGYHLDLTPGQMSRGQHWAGIAHRGPCAPLDGIHIASAAANIGEIVVCASVLPWNGAGRYWLDPTHGTGPRTRRAVEQIDSRLPTGCVVWGGDFNHTLAGKPVVASRHGRDAINAMITRRNMTAPTTALRHRITGGSIDHILIPAVWTVTQAERIEVGTLSDHDAYTVDLLST
jgi:endonuclease/exonuclease/phosphatase family metal-dependent hydrolase